MAGIFQSMRLSRMIGELTDEQIRSVLSAYEDMGGVAFGSLGVVASPKEDLRMLLGMASMNGRDPEALLRTLIETARRTGFATSTQGSLRNAPPDELSQDDLKSENHSVPIPSRSEEPPQGASPPAAERTQVRSSTSVRMRHAAEEYGLEQLEATLSKAPNLVQFSDLDGALQIAIDIVVRRISEGRSEEVRRYCGSTVITGYIVGRAMLGTAGGALHYSNPLTEADNVESLVKLATTSEAARYTNEMGPTGLLFMEFQIEIAGRAGPLSAFALEDRSNLAGGSAAAGLILAIVEHDLFAA